MTKQKVLQISIAVTTVLGVIAGFAPYMNLLPESWQKYGLGAIGLSIMAEKILISTNQILVGPSKLQSAAVQTSLAELPDKSTADENKAPQGTINPSSPVAPHME